MGQYSIFQKASNGSLVPVKKGQFNFTDKKTIKIKNCPTPQCAGQLSVSIFRSGSTGNQEERACLIAL